MDCMGCTINLFVSLQNQHVQHQLAMFFRDELISWSWRRPPGASPANGAAGGMSLAELKSKVAENVDQVINRVQKIAPQCFPEEVCLPLPSIVTNSPPFQYICDLDTFQLLSVC